MEDKEKLLKEIESARIEQDKCCRDYHDTHLKYYWATEAFRKSTINLANLENKLIILKSK